jgi:hypothetical protein
MHKKLENLTFGEIYLIFINDFLTIEKMAEHYQVNEDLLKHWIECGKTGNCSSISKDWEELQEFVNELYFNI